MTYNQEMPRVTESVVAYLAAVPESEVEGKAGDALRLGTRGYLQGFDNARITLMLETRILALSVLANYGKVDIGMTGGDPGERFAQDYRCVNVKLLTHRDIPGYVTGLGDWSKQDAFGMVVLHSETKE
jgi:hypothetical protein